MRASTLIVLLVLAIAVAVFAQQVHEYVAAPPAVWQALHDGGWPIWGSPRYSDDSTRVIFCNNDQVPFTAGELSVLRSYLDVTIVGSDSVKVWMAANGWTDRERP